MNDNSLIIMSVQDDEMLIRDETFRNIVRPDSNIHQSGSSDISTCLSNNVEVTFSSYKSCFLNDDSDQ